MLPHLQLWRFLNLDFWRIQSQKFRIQKQKIIWDLFLWSIETNNLVFFLIMGNKSSDNKSLQIYKSFRSIYSVFVNNMSEIFRMWGFVCGMPGHLCRIPGASRAVGPSHSTLPFSCHTYVGLISSTPHSTGPEA